MIMLRTHTKEAGGLMRISHSISHKDIVIFMSLLLFGPYSKPPCEAIQGRNYFFWIYVKAPVPSAVCHM